MSTAAPQPARTSRLRPPWRAFRRLRPSWRAVRRSRPSWRAFRQWRRARPFWGGLLTLLAGLEIFGTTQMSLGGLTVQMGPTGFLSWLIPTILVTCGLLIWFSAHQRIFYAVVAAVTAIFALIGVNLGGFFVGMLLGIVGSALAFAWTRDPRPPDQHGSEPADGSPDQHGSEPADGSPDQHGSEPADGSPDQHRAAGSPDPRVLPVLLGLAGLTAVTALAAPAPAQGSWANGLFTSALPAGCPTPAPSSAEPGRPLPSPTDSPRPTPTGTLGQTPTGARDPSPTGPPSSRPSPTAPPSDPPATPSPRPTGAGCPGPAPRPTEDTETGEPLPRISPDAEQPVVNVVPSKLTGSKVTMTKLRFEGIVDLPTAEGTLKTLKFSMVKAVTDDFLLRVPGPADRTMRFATNELTIRGSVDFYTTRFAGRFLGIKIVLTPDLPLPDGIPLPVPIPISFTDPEIDLAFVTSDTLTAKPQLRLALD
ncbi:DUF6114 domain-containing protein [Salinispora arenicola]|uniref:Uncharacterized protein n=1 Tax=Salinispora arenicola TaxID=168697 RepID=A0A542XJG3_SALAC|nr:DUF6114 domain-containing protein [Salinispora arenicola]TQL35995.1 hypothetical protein FB564_1069 [Salinispora arenicola]GIM82955.1 hypothetical protein Sar04_09810 [Salinispora arenicola]